jgi:hypothetical protein
VLIVGLTDGFAEAEVKPVGLEAQLYVFPLTGEAPIVADVPEQTLLALPTVAAGKGLTETVTEFDFEQPFEFVSINVYVVVIVGAIVGFEPVELNPVGLDDQLYVLPLTAEAPILVLVPVHIDELEPALAAGSALVVTVIREVSFNALASEVPLGFVVYAFILLLPAAKLNTPRFTETVFPALREPLQL